MSLTTESSLQGRSRANFGRWSRRLCRLFCWCLPQNRRVVPTNPLPDHSDLMTFGKKGDRIICVLHYEPAFNDMLLRRHSFAIRRKKIASEYKRDDCDSDSSSDEYWFTKWTMPLRTVRRYQLEHLKKQGQPSHQKNQESYQSCDISPPQSAAISVFAKNQSALIIKEASQEVVAKLSTSETEDQNPASPVSRSGSGPVGIVNPSFESSPSDPGTEASKVPITTLMHAKPVLYFIHGAGESSESWRPVSQYFACLHYEIVAIDLLGHGFSSTPNRGKSYTFHKILGDVLRVFDEHVFNGKKSVVIGHGYGCSFAVALSRQRASHVSLLALLSSGGPTPLAPPINWRRELKLPASLLGCFRTFLPCGIKRNVLYGPRGKNCMHETVHFKSLPAYVQHHLALGQAWPEGDVAFHRKISVPTLLVHGLKDKYVSLVEMCEMERTIPRAFLEVIPESGHDLMAEAPEQLCKMLRKFIEHWER